MIHPVIQISFIIIIAAGRIRRMRPVVLILPIYEVLRAVETAI
jgi:hypothetical protein